MALDASAIIALLDPGDAHHLRASALIEAEDELCMSTMTLAEVLAGGGEEGVRADLEALDVSEVGLPAGSAPPLAALRRSTRLRLPDCCVLLAAETTGAEAVATFDERLARVARERGLRVP
jgi:predicted nucleic acid-binding protein